MITVRNDIRLWFLILQLLDKNQVNDSTGQTTNLDFDKAHTVSADITDTTPSSTTVVAGETNTQMIVSGTLPDVSNVPQLKGLAEQVGYNFCNSFLGNKYLLKPSVHTAQ